MEEAQERAALRWTPGVLTSLACFVPSVVGLHVLQTPLSLLWTLSAAVSAANHATGCRDPVIGPVDRAAAFANVVASTVLARTRAFRLACVYVAGSYVFLTRGRGKRLYRDPVHLSGHLAGGAGLCLEVLRPG